MKFWANLFFVLLGLCHVAPSTSFGDVFPLAVERTYSLSNDVSFGDLKDPAIISAYKVTGSVKVGAVWTKDESKLLRFELVSPKLTFKSRPSKLKDFIEKPSSIVHLAAKPFYALWTNGRISQTYFKSEGTDVTALNFLKGIVSLFQYQLLDGNYNENDVTGNCDVVYTSKSSTKYVKTKLSCNTLDANYRQRVEKPLDVTVTPSRSTEYVVNEEGSVERVESLDYVKLSVNAFPGTGAFVESRFQLKFDGFSTTIPKLEGETVESCVASLKEYKQQLTNSFYERSCIDEECFSLIKFVKNYKDALKDKFVGSHSSAQGLLKLIPIARLGKSEEFERILSAKSTKPMQKHLYDLLGAVQTTESHAAAKKLMNLTEEETLDLNERYLQAVGLSTRPNSVVIADLLHTLETTPVMSTKLKQTFVLAIASAAKKFAELPGNSYKTKLVEAVELYVLGSLDKCEEEECQLALIRALQNLRSPNTVQRLQTFAADGATRISVTAMKALRAFRPDLWIESDKKLFKTIFYQLTKKYDSSARTIALDILLECKLADEDLFELVEYLKAADKAFEVKQYLFQKLKMKAQSNRLFHLKLESLIKSDPELNNYHILGVRGLTTALARVFSKKPSFNATLVSIQEINNGLLKQGLVDLVIHSNDDKFSMLSVGLYAAGLSSFVDSSEEEVEQEDVTTTAGMEIGVQEVLLRPLEFFNGKSELFGHVWSGTASESTPAYQAVSVLQDHQEVLRLQNGAIVDLSVLGTLSIDLNGQVQISLWNKNARSQVVKNIGIAVNGRVMLDASFVQFRSEFTITEEPQLDLATDIDFSSKIALCVRPNTPEKVTNHQQVSSEIITQGGVNNRFIKNYSYKISGYSYLLNQKNNEMCNDVFAS